MSEPNASEPIGPHDAMLDDALAVLRGDSPQTPPLVYRMHLIQALVHGGAADSRQAMAIVDDYYRRKGLGIRQPTPLQAVLFAVALSVILIGPCLLLYWLWHQFFGR